MATSLDPADNDKDKNTQDPNKNDSGGKDKDSSTDFEKKFQELQDALLNQKTDLINQINGVSKKFETALKHPVKEEKKEKPSITADESTTLEALRLDLNNQIENLKAE